MATPIGHTLAGLTALTTAPRRPLRPLVLLAVVMANVPDLDFLPGILVGMPTLYHQGVTHSLAAAALASFVGAIVLRHLGLPFGAAFRVGLAAYASHLALDLVGPDARLPFGIPLFWPLSDAHFLSPVPLLPGVHHAARTESSISEWLTGILVMRNIGAMAVEVGLFGPIAWLATRRGHVRRPAVG
jgi:inner membrane protein